jgi:hypothetical protein
MVTESNENSKEPDKEGEETNMEEFHDATTVHTGETFTLTGAEWKEIHLLIKITYKDGTEAIPHRKNT